MPIRRAADCPPYGTAEPVWGEDKSVPPGRLAKTHACGRYGDYRGFGFANLPQPRTVDGVPVAAFVVFAFGGLPGSSARGQASWSVSRFGRESRAADHALADVLVAVQVGIPRPLSESLTWMARRRPRPTMRSRSRPWSAGRPLGCGCRNRRRRCGGIRHTPARAGGSMRARMAASCSNVCPMELPMPAVVSSRRMGHRFSASPGSPQPGTKGAPALGRDARIPPSTVLGCFRVFSSWSSSSAVSSSPAAGPTRGELHSRPRR